MQNLKAIVAASLISLAAIAPSHAASQCKGLAETQCQANAACRWSPAIVKGAKSPTTGKPYKVNRKAHCRALPKRKATKKQ